ncbi:MAG: hypothetical protein LBT85_03705, partial [Bifidobacteriaceae bacterium]|nr:hypothetical protein [Bifidobacteriaceae bacterium]
MATLKNMKTLQKFTKHDWINLLCLETFCLAFIIFLVQYSSHLGLVFASVSDYMTQHVTLLDSFRQNFWNWQKPI